MDTKQKRPVMPYQDKHQELIEKCRKGDHSSQFMIYKLYYKAMYNVSLRIVKDPMEAEDIMQEAFLTAFEKINTFSGSVAFGAWLRKIVQNKSLDYIKKSGRIAFVELDSLNGIPDTAGPRVSFDELIEKRYRQVRAIVTELPDKYRNIISLHLLEGFDPEEISQIMSAPSNTVRSQLCRAKRMVRTEFDLRHSTFQF